MMILGVRMEKHEVFEFAATDGSLTFKIDVTLMWEALQDALARGAKRDEVEFEVFDAAMDPAWVEHVKVNCGIEEEHMARLRSEEADTPIPLVLCVLADDGTTIQVDGHHRLLLWAERGRTTYPVCRWKAGTWQQFLVNEDGITIVRH